MCVYSAHVCSCIGNWSGVPLNIIIGSLRIIIKKITLISLKTFSLKKSTANVGVFFFGDSWPTGHPHNMGSARALSMATAYVCMCIMWLVLIVANIECSGIQKKRKWSAITWYHSLADTSLVHLLIQLREGSWLCVLWWKLIVMERTLDLSNKVI